MPSTLHVIVCALVALAVWTAIGWPVARRVFGTSLALPFAPVTGWAVHNAIAVPLFFVVPFDAISVVGIAAAVGVLGAAWAARSRDAGGRSTGEERVPIPAVAWVGAAALAALCAVAILPKQSGDAVYVATQVYDHAKIALIDDIARLGMPPGNPFMAPERAGERLAYYYLWHFSAAELARVLPVSGWEADAAMTFFSAFTSLAALMAIAVRFSGRASASGLVVLLAAAASSRRLWLAAFGPATVDAWIAPPAGFGGWLFQSAWVPQHVASTTCVVLALFAIEALAARVTALGVVTLGLLAAAAFESSTWVGGVVQGIVCACVVPWVVLRAEPRRRGKLVGALFASGVVAVVVAAPFLVDQSATAAARQQASPIALHPWPVIGEALPTAVRAWLDVPAFWIAMLPIEWTAAYLFGLWTIVRVLRARPARGTPIATLAVATLAALVSSSLLVSTLADNNDLGWRAALLSSVLLIPLAAAGIAGLAHERRRAAVACAAVAIAVGMPEAFVQFRGNVEGHPNPSGVEFARAPALWAQVRRYASPDERVANNPLALDTMTPWAVNLGWSLFADRRSCYATWELTQVYSSVPHERLRAIDARFVRVFAGQALPGDVDALARTFDCRVVVVTPADGAWRDDPFARSADYRLVDEADDRWRIYRRVDAKPEQPATR